MVGAYASDVYFNSLGGGGSGFSAPSAVELHRTAVLLELARLAKGIIHGRAIGRCDESSLLEVVNTQGRIARWMTY